MLMPPTVLHIAKACADASNENSKYKLQCVLVGQEDSEGFAVATDSKVLIVAQWPLKNANAETKWECLVPQRMFHEQAALLDENIDPSRCALAWAAKDERFSDFPNLCKVAQLNLSRQGEGVVQHHANAERGAMPAWRNFMIDPEGALGVPQGNFCPLRLSAMADVVDKVTDPDPDKRLLELYLCKNYMLVRAVRKDGDAVAITVTGILAPLK